MEDEKNTVKLTSANPKELAEYAVKILDSKKAKDLKLIHVEDKTVIADYFVVCSGTSSTQVKSLAEEVEYQLAASGCAPARIEGDGTGGWILLDFASVIVHVFSVQSREFYNVEKLFDEEDFEDISALISEE